jgi:tetratricopeptide (TPR) repeat protein
MPIDHPLLQYRRGDVPGLLIAFPATSPPERDRLFIQDVVAVADPSELDGAGVVVSARMHWWGQLWNRPLGPVLAGLASLPLPETDEEVERWRLATAAALELPAVVDTLTRFVTSDDYEQARALARESDILVSPRWRLTVDVAADALLQHQVDAEAAELLRHRLGRLRQMQLLGIEVADDTELTGDLARLVTAATTADDADDRLTALLELRRRLEVEEPTPLAAAAQTSLVVALLQDPGLRVDGVGALREAERAVELARSALGDDHLLTRTAVLNLAVATEQRPDTDRDAALSAAEAILHQLAPAVARTGHPLVADVATNLATIASQRAGGRADNPEETAALLDDARHISLLLERDDRRSTLVALVDAAASLRARMTGSLRANALRSLAQLREATDLEAEWKVLSPAEGVLLLGNLANALQHVREHAPGGTSRDEVATAARNAAEAVGRLDQLHPVGIDTLTNAGAVLADLYSESLRTDAPDHQLWQDARDYLLDALGRAEALYSVGHPARLRAMANLATVYARPVDDAPADPERCAELLGAVIADAPDHRSEFALAAATNLGQLRIGQGRWDDAATAYEVATSAQRRLVHRARTPLTKLGEIVSTADLAARRALALAMGGRYPEAADALDENRGRLVRARGRPDPYADHQTRTPTTRAQYRQPPSCMPRPATTGPSGSSAFPTEHASASTRRSPAGK